MRTFLEEYRTQDKSTWGVGPWQEEPDKAVWVDEATGLDCMVNRGPSGAWCGYVGVAPGHLLHGRGYSMCLTHGEECEDHWQHSTPDSIFRVHGGLTYADKCQPTDDPTKHVCHIPQPGRPDDVWWLGFDCAHLHDFAPGMAARHPEDTRLPTEVYRDLNYVVREVERLASQLAEADAIVEGARSEEGS